MAQVLKSDMHWREKYARVAAEGELYFVKKVWDRRTELDGTRSYLVSWHGYPSSERNWEPQDNFFCPESRALIEKFDVEKDREEAEAEKKRLKMTQSAEKKSPEMIEENQDDYGLQDALSYLFGANIPKEIRKAMESKKALNTPIRKIATTSKKATRNSRAANMLRHFAQPISKMALQPVAKTSQKAPRRSTSSSNKRAVSQPSKTTSADANTRQLRSNTSTTEKKTIRQATVKSSVAASTRQLRSNTSASNNNKTRQPIAKTSAAANKSKTSASNKKATLRAIAKTTAYTARLRSHASKKRKS